MVKSQKQAIETKIVCEDPMVFEGFNFFKPLNDYQRSSDLTP